MNQLVNKVLFIACFLMLILMLSLYWFMASHAPDENVNEIYPLEAIIHDQMYHQDTEGAQDPNSILQQFKRRTPLPEQE